MLDLDEEWTQPQYDAARQNCIEYCDLFNNLSGYPAFTFFDPGFMGIPKIISLELPQTVQTIGSQQTPYSYIPEVMAFIEQHDLRGCVGGGPLNDNGVYSCTLRIGVDTPEQIAKVERLASIAPEWQVLIQRIILASKPSSVFETFSKAREIKTMRFGREQIDNADLSQLLYLRQYVAKNKAALSTMEEMIAHLANVEKNDASGGKRTQTAAYLNNIARMMPVLAVVIQEKRGLESSRHNTPPPVDLAQLRN